MEQYVDDLFLNVLGLRNPPKHWRDPWVEQAVGLRDPLVLFNRFIASKAAVERRARDEDTKTRWPHGHFYSPVASRSEVAADWPRLSRPRSLEGIDLRAEAQRDLVGRLAPHFASLPFNDEKTPAHRYHFDNPSYNFGDALIYWAMLNHLRPKRILEVGSGFSSALALDAIDLLGLPTVCTFVDPFPEVAREATAPLGPQHAILGVRIQDVDLGILDALGENDILFIDSSHIVKTGSDVQFELSEMLPRLKPGVIVHFHDVFYPFEYHRRWAVEENHSWNEIYFLHAFLMFNSGFRIELFNHFVAKTQADSVAAAMPQHVKRFLQNPGGGLWLRRV